MMDTENRYLKVIDKPGLQRDTQTGAILNTSTDELDKYIEQRNVLMAQRKRIDNLERDVSDIKDMLKQILGKL